MLFQVSASFRPNHEYRVCMSCFIAAGASGWLARSLVTSRKKWPDSWRKVLGSADLSRAMAILPCWSNCKAPRSGWNSACVSIAFSRIDGVMSKLACFVDSVLTVGASFSTSPTIGNMLSQSMLFGFSHWLLIMSTASDAESHRPLPGPLRISSAGAMTSNDPSSATMCTPLASASTRTRTC